MAGGLREAPHRGLLVVVDYVRWPDRREAGRALGEALEGYADDDTVVVGLPRGGVAVAVEVAAILGAPLEVVVVRKLGAPGQPELGIGAVGPGRVRVVHEALARRLGLTEADIEAIAAREHDEVRRRMERYVRGPGVDFAGRTVIVVDDGIATGGTARAALEVLRAQEARRIVLAVPVCPFESVEVLREEFDDVVVLATPRPFLAVGEHYTDFHQVTDAEVRAFLDESVGREG